MRRLDVNGGAGRSMGGGPLDAVRRVTVVVPARNEERLIGRCLRGLDGARRRLGRRRPDVEVEVVVVLDAGTDRTADIVTHHGDVTLLTVEAACVGAARQAGIRHVLEGGHGDDGPAGSVDPVDLLGHLDHGTHWVTNTGADSVVPSSWLLEQLAIAEAGHDVVVGLVEPDPSELGADVLARWRGRHRLVEGHDHVHGANLAFRLSTYVAAGGFEPLPVHEDVRLVERMRTGGARVVATARVRVRTSARTTGRAPQGFAGYLDELAGGAAAVEAS